MAFVADWGITKKINRLNSNDAFKNYAIKTDMPQHSLPFTRAAGVANFDAPLTGNFGAVLTMVFLSPVTAGWGAWKGDGSLKDRG
jgi:hypothetical protein